MVLADAENLEAHLVGQFDLLKEITQPLGGVDGLSGRGIGGGFREGVNAEFHAPHIVEPALTFDHADSGRDRGSDRGLTLMAEREVYFEFTTVGAAVKVVAIDSETAIEVSVMGPASASQADMKQLGMRKLKARLAREGAEKP